MSITKYSISKSDFFEGWPTMVKLKDGGLLCVFTRCNGHIDRDNTSLMTTVSLDGGETWSTPSHLTEVTDKSYYYNNARVRRLGDVIAIVCDKIHENEKSENPADVFIWISEDEGKTWSEPKKTAANGIVPDIKRLRNGNWLLTAHRTDKETGKLIQYGYISENQGETWSDEITVAKDPRYNLCEASVIEMENGTLVAFLRENSRQGIDCLKTISYDGGFTWSEVYNVPIPGCHRPTANFLKNGKILLTYRYMQGGKPTGFSSANTFMTVLEADEALLTDRNGQTSVIIPLDIDRSGSPDSGYTDWVELDDKTVYIVNYIIDDWKKCQIRGYKVTLDEIIF